MTPQLRSVLLYILFTLPVLILAGIVAVVHSPRFTVQDAMAVVQAVGVVVGVRFAALNLREIRRAAEDETAPLLHCVLREVRSNGNPGFAIEVHNLGRGGVVAASLECWARQSDLVTEGMLELQPHEVELNVSRIASGEQAKAELYLPWMTHAMLHDFVVRVTYDSVRERRATATWHFTEIGGRLSLSPLPAPTLLPPE